MVILFYAFYHRFYGIGPHTEGKACSEQSVLPRIVTNPSAGAHPLISASLKLSCCVKSAGIQVHILHYWCSYLCQYLFKKLSGHVPKISLIVLCTLPSNIIILGQSFLSDGFSNNSNQR